MPPIYVLAAKLRTTDLIHAHTQGRRLSLWCVFLRVLELRARKLRVIVSVTPARRGAATRERVEPSMQDFRI